MLDGRFVSRIGSGSIDGGECACDVFRNLLYTSSRGDTSDNDDMPTLPISKFTDAADGMPNASQVRAK